MSKKPLILLLALTCTAPVVAQPDPTVTQVYEAASSGHLEQAQQMIDQVLRDHPRSGKAHFVAAEIYAREGQTSAARRELAAAEQLEPGVPFAKPAAVEALRRELAQEGHAIPVPFTVRPRSAIPWGTILLVLGGIGVVWLVVRRRTAAYSQYPGSVTVPAGGPYGGPGYGAPGYGPGVGSGIAGGLASGLAVGAGVVAGEELARHFLDSGRREDVIVPPDEVGVSGQNADMGGSDFGVSDPGSWDDGGSGSSFSGDMGGGDGWT